ncbi:MAG: hypothetical protein HXY34_06215 [Candidatus Thorarchaeota archaeon]|nr:hypothetical protein [Candidatus Thorarchaeota archaeon]
MMIRSSALALLLILLLGAAASSTAPSVPVRTSDYELEYESVIAATSLQVEVDNFNYLKAFDDDDFAFHVYNYTYQVGGANVSIYFLSNKTIYSSKLSLGDGSAVFYNIPQGSYTYNVTWQAAPGVQQSGVLVSNGPDAFTTPSVGNLDRENDLDDLQATVLDVDDNPAQGLNFSIHFQSNNSIWGQVILGANGFANFTDLPNDNYTWKVTVMSGPYTGSVIKSGNFTADGTAKLVHQWVGPITGNPDYYDLEVFTYYETTLDALQGAIVNVTYKNGMSIDAKTTPTNGTVLFIDLPIAFINWTVKHMGEYLGLGNYSYDLTSASSDVRKPVITSPGDKEFLVDSKNITVAWHVEDEHPKQLNVYLDGVVKVTQSYNATSYDYLYNVTGFAIGVYNVKFEAIDLNNNKAEDTIRLRIYENVTPVIDGPENLTIYYMESGRTLRWNISDAHPSAYTLTRNTTVVKSGNISLTEPYVRLSLDGLAIGYYEFVLSANDTSGNTANHTVGVTVKADDIAPVITYAPPSVSYYRGDARIVRNWTVTDDHKSKYSIAVDGFVVVEAVWVTDTISFDFSGLLEGEHWVVLTVYDVGNNTAVSAVHVTVYPPQVVLGLAYAGGIVILVVIIIAVRIYLRRR